MTRFVTELGYVGLEVSDLKKWEVFAAEGLGLTVEKGPRPNMLRLRMDEHNHRFLLTEGPADDIAYAGWRVPNARVFADFKAYLKSLGIGFEEASREELAVRDVDGMVWLNDPIGTRHEVYYSPLINSFRFISPKVQTSFVTGECGCGHIVLPAPKYKEAVEFADKVFGFRITDQVRIGTGSGTGMEVSFMHINPRHHSMAFVQVPGGPKRLHHFMLEVNSVEDVGRARDRCLNMGYDMGMDIGQHPNDNMISFYTQTPSGFLIEYGCVGTQIDIDRWQTGHYTEISEWGHRPLASHAKKAGPAAAASGASPAKVDGRWSVVLKTPMGDQAMTFHLQTSGGKLTGKVVAPNETNEVLDGTVNGNELFWRNKVTSPMAMDVEMTARIEGDSISGGGKSPFGTAPFSGSRMA